MKRLISVLLSAVLAAGLLTPALAATPSFSDVSDPELSARVDSLRMLGVVAGDTAGTFRPNSTLTRAEFCVMAVNAMGNAGQVALYSTRTIFPDVRSDHWARGYINLAASGKTKIIAGTDQGVFEPDSPITYGQAVTILIRILGYTDEDTGMLWPDGFIALAEKIGLADGLSGLGGSDPITRGQAATLFCNLLTTEQKEGGLYAAELGTIQQNAVILALDVETADGEDGIRAVTGTATGVYAVANGVIPQSSPSSPTAASRRRWWSGRARPAGSSTAPAPGTPSPPTPTPIPARAGPPMKRCSPTWAPAAWPPSTSAGAP